MDSRGQSRLEMMGNIRSSGIRFPNQRFFTPTQRFWDIISLINPRRIIDAGAGGGHLQLESKYRCKHIPWISLDIIPRDGAGHVLLRDAVCFPYIKGDLVLCCRPDHSGWCSELIDNVRYQGADVVYIGLKRNLDNDITDEQLQSYDSRSKSVGEEREILYGWGPSFSGVNGG